MTFAKTTPSIQNQAVKSGRSRSRLSKSLNLEREKGEEVDYDFCSDSPRALHESFIRGPTLEALPLEKSNLTSGSSRGLRKRDVIKRLLFMSRPLPNVDTLKTQTSDTLSEGDGALILDAQKMMFNNCTHKQTLQSNNNTSPLHISNFGPTPLKQDMADTNLLSEHDTIRHSTVERVSAPQFTDDLNDAVHNGIGTQPETMSTSLTESLLNLLFDVSSHDSTTIETPTEVDPFNHMDLNSSPETSPHHVSNSNQNFLLDQKTGISFNSDTFPASHDGTLQDLSQSKLQHYRRLTQGLYTGIKLDLDKSDSDKGHTLQEASSLSEQSMSGHKGQKADEVLQISPEITETTRASVEAFRKLQEASLSNNASPAFHSFVKDLGSHEMLMERGLHNMDLLFRHQLSRSLKDIYSLLHAAYAFSKSSEHKFEKSTEEVFKNDLQLWKNCLQESEPIPFQKKGMFNPKTLLDEIANVMWEEMNSALQFLNCVKSEAALRSAPTVSCGKLSLLHNLALSKNVRSDDRLNTFTRSGVSQSKRSSSNGVLRSLLLVRCSSANQNRYDASNLDVLKSSPWMRILNGSVMTHVRLLFDTIETWKSFYWNISGLYKHCLGTQGLIINTISRNTFISLFNQISQGIIKATPNTQGFKTPLKIASRMIKREVIRDLKGLKNYLKCLANIVIHDKAAYKDVVSAIMVHCLAAAEFSKITEWASPLRQVYSTKYLWQCSRELDDQWSTMYNARQHENDQQSGSPIRITCTPSVLNTNHNELTQVHPFVSVLSWTNLRSPMDIDDHVSPARVVDDFMSIDEIDGKLVPTPETIASEEHPISSCSDNDIVLTSPSTTSSQSPSLPAPTSQRPMLKRRRGNSSSNSENGHLSGDAPLICQICGSTFAQLKANPKTNLRRHMRTMHNKDAPKYSCDKCHYTSTRIDNRDKHECRKHKYDRKKELIS